MKSIFTNWMTSLAGIGAILGAVGVYLVALSDGDPTTVPNILVTWTAIVTGIGLIFTRDANKTSKQSGAE